MDGQQASRLLDLISSVPGGLWTILGILIALFLALATFSMAMWRYGGDIKKINETQGLRAFYPLTKMLGSANEHLAAQAIVLDKQTGTLETTNQKVVDALAKLEDVLVKLNEDFLPRLNSMSAAASESKGQQLADAQIGEARIDASANGGNVPPPSPAGSPPVPVVKPGQRYSSTEGKWSMFTDAFRDRVAKTKLEWDGRAIGWMAYELTDRRRTPSAVIPLELADEISALHGAWKSYNAAKDSMWKRLTAEVQSEFESRVERVTRRVRS